MTSRLPTSWTPTHCTERTPCWAHGVGIVRWRCFSAFPPRPPARPRRHPPVTSKVSCRCNIGCSCTLSCLAPAGTLSTNSTFRFELDGSTQEPCLNSFIGKMVSMMLHVNVCMLSQPMPYCVM